MKARTRSISGAVMMLVIIPLFAGLLACMPVPIGDPDRSRIDPAMSGFWIMSGEGEAGSLYLFRPYDKRTWLVIGLELEVGHLAEFDEFDPDTPEDLAQLLRAHEVGVKGIIADDPTIYKGWLARIGGRRFMTWEAIGDIHYPESFAPEYWLVFAIEEQRKGHYKMRTVAPDENIFEKLLEAKDEDGWDPRKARKQWERTLRKNINNPDIYAEDPLEMHRLPDDLFDKAVSLANMAMPE